MLLRDGIDGKYPIFTQAKEYTEFLWLIHDKMH